MLKREMVIRALKVARAYRDRRNHADLNVWNRISHDVSLYSADVPCRQASLFADDPQVELEPWQIDDTKPQYRIDVGGRSYYALDDAEREGILARIEAEGIKGRVEIWKFTDDREEVLPMAVDDEPVVPVELTQGDSARASHVATVPPKGAEFVLYLLLSKEDRESIPGDLQEEFIEVILPRFGRRRASVWYWTQVVRSILPLATARLLRLVKFVIFARITATVARWLGS